MFYKPQDTTFNAGLDVNKTATELRKHLIEFQNDSPNQFIAISNGDVYDNFALLALGDGNYVNPRPFTNPLEMKVDSTTYLIFDARSSTKYDRVSNKSNIKNQSLFRRDYILAALQSSWINEGTDSVIRLGHMQVYCFATWLANLITKRFALDLAQQQTLTIITAFYYLCLFNDGEHELDIGRMMKIISRATGISSTAIHGVIGELPHIGNIIEYIKLIKEVLYTDRLEGLTPDILVVLLGGSWFGPNHSEIVATALEYPPTFCGLIYLGLTDRANKSTGLAQVALKKERDPMGRDFLNLTSTLLHGQSTNFDF